MGGRQRGEGACKFDSETHEWMDLPDMGTGRRCPGKYDTLLVASTLNYADQAVWVRALAKDIILCSWERHLILTRSASLRPGV